MPVDIIERGREGERKYTRDLAKDKCDFLTAF